MKEFSLLISYHRSFNRAQEIAFFVQIFQATKAFSFPSKLFFGMKLSQSLFFGQPLDLDFYLFQILSRFSRTRTTKFKILANSAATNIEVISDNNFAG